MIKKLRRKFICINMTIITIILVVILCAIIHLTGQNLERNSMQTLHELASEPFGAKHPGRQPEVRQPYFLLRMDQDGTVIETKDLHFPISDSDTLEELIQTALDTSADTQDIMKKNAPKAIRERSGVIPALHVRYLCTDTPQGQCLVFVDISGEESMRTSLIRNCLLIGIAGFFVFFIISMLFAHWAVRPVESAWNEQKQFVADASHELKTPLTVILTNAELLQSPEYNTNMKQHFSDNILTMAQQMRTLVEGLLELSRADSGSLQLAMEHVNLGELIEHALCLFEPLYFEHSLTLHSELADDVWVNGSPTHLKQVIDILLDNALKYSDSGSEVLVRLETQRHHCLLSVTSYGETISHADLKQIFQRFYRVDKSRTHSNSYGLGLSIAESIVKKHHGKIWAESAAHRNTFFVQLHLLTKASDHNPVLIR
ncbi:MAG: sensor histidine kinase [Lachnospiraceae bacterium]